VRATLPPELAALSDLVMNLRWSWHQETLDLFASVDPELWGACGHDPVRLLGAVSPARLSALSKDKRFLRRLSDAADDLADYLAQPRWYQEQTEVPRSIAYFSMEIALDPNIPTYSGGLGMLAGDTLRSVADLARDLGISAGGLSTVLMKLELKKAIRRLPWNTFERR
jgi:starch phosphorylase